MQKEEKMMENKEYREGYEQGVKDFAERIENYYRHLSGKTLPATVQYYIEQIKKEMLEND